MPWYLRLGLVRAEDSARHANQRFEDGKRFERRQLSMRLQGLIMRDDRRHKLAHDLGLCGCSDNCCCYKDAQ